MKNLRIAAWIGFALVAGVIFYLTTQTPEATIQASRWAAEHLPSFLIEPKWPDGSVLLTARQMAHIYQFFVLGLCAALAMLGCTRISPAARALSAAAICLVCSLADQTHKLFVPGREFDGRDLALDAVGYCAAVAFIFFIRWLIVRKRKQSREKAVPDDPQAPVPPSV